MKRVRTANAKFGAAVAAAGQGRLCCMAAGLALIGIATAWSGAVGMQHIWALLVVAPVAEETIFRAGLQEYLLRWLKLPFAANGLTALAFGLAHVTVRGDWTAFTTVIPALLIGWTYERWRRLRLCVALHCVMNALWLAWRL